MSVSLTPRAADRLRSMMFERGLSEEVYLRIAVTGGSCDHLTYRLDVTAGKHEDDEVFESNGIRMICDPKSHSYLNGSEVDFVEAPVGGGFVFRNPNAARTCPCGLSFTTKTE